MTNRSKEGMIGLEEGGGEGGKGSRGGLEGVEQVPRGDMKESEGRRGGKIEFKDRGCCSLGDNLWL